MSKTPVPNFRPFAHMKVPDLEVAAAAAAAAHRAEEEETEEEKEKREKEEKEAKAKKAEEEEQERKDKEAKAKKAEEDEEARRAESEKEDDDKKEKEARADERRRVKAILDSEAGVRLPKAAKRLALDGSLSASDAIAMLEAVGEDKAAASGSKLAERMASATVPALGAGDVQRGSGPSLADQIVKAGSKARGEI